MRFHKFDYPKAGRGQATEVWIDLDAVVSVRRGGLADTESEITAGNWTHLVAMPLEDVLALISPSAAPDTFEEDLAAHMAKLREQGGQGPLNMAPPPVSVDISEALEQGERRIRLDELYRLANRFVDPLGLSPLTSYIDARRAEIEHGA